MPTDKIAATPTTDTWNQLWYTRAHKLAQTINKEFHWFEAGPTFVRIIDYLFRSKFSAQLKGPVTPKKIAALATPEVGEELGQVLQSWDVTFAWDKPKQSQAHEQFLFLQVGVLRVKQLREGKGEKLAR